MIIVFFTGTFNIQHSPQHLLDHLPSGVWERPQIQHVQSWTPDLFFQTHSTHNCPYWGEASDAISWESYHYPGRTHKLGHGTDFKIPLGFRAVKMWKAKYSGTNDIWVAGSSLRVSSLASYTKHAAAMTGREPPETPTSDSRPHSFMKQGFPGNLLFTRHYGYRNEDTASAPRGIWVQ